MRRFINKVNYERAVVWERMEFCDSVMKSEDFGKVVMEAVSEYYMEPERKLKTVYEDDIRNMPIIRCIQYVSENGDANTRQALLQAVLKTYKDIVNSFTWVTGDRIVSSYVNLYCLVPDSCILSDLKTMTVYIILEEIFKNVCMSPVRDAIISEIKRQETNVYMARSV